MLDFPVQNYGGIGQMAIFITRYKKVLLHQGVIDIHFLDRGGWRSIMYPCPISQEYLWAPLAKTVRATASHLSISGTKRASVLLKFDCVLYCNTRFCWLWLWKNPFTSVSHHTHC